MTLGGEQYLVSKFEGIVVAVSVYLTFHPGYDFLLSLLDETVDLVEFLF